MVATTIMIGCASPALAQTYIDPGTASQPTTTLRDPLVTGAYNTAVQGTPMTPMLPPPGSAGDPTQVTPGMTDDAGYEPWVQYIPANTSGITDSYVSLPLTPATATAPGDFNTQVGSSIPPEPSTPGNDPGILAPNNSGYTPPAQQITITSTTPPTDTAPTQKWGGATTKDYGTNLQISSSSRVYDFGQKLSQNPNVAQQPQDSQDGPRPFTIPDDYSTPWRQPQMQNSYGQAQETTDSGIRILFPSTGQQALETFNQIETEPRFAQQTQQQ
jgi:hypothetical protein